MYNFTDMGADEAFHDKKFSFEAEYGVAVAKEIMDALEEPHLFHDYSGQIWEAG